MIRPTSQTNTRPKHNVPFILIGVLQTTGKSKSDLKRKKPCQNQTKPNLTETHTPLLDKKPSSTHTDTTPSLSIICFHQTIKPSSCFSLCSNKVPNNPPPTAFLFLSSFIHFFSSSSSLSKRILNNRIH